MAKLNLHTWTRVTRLDLLNLSACIGNAAIGSLKLWPLTGEGREVKAATERIATLLDGTLDRRDVDHAFDNLLSVISEFKLILANSFFLQHLETKIYADRSSQKLELGAAINTNISNIENFVSTSRPSKAVVDIPIVARVIEHPAVLAAEFDLGMQLNDVTPIQQSAPLQFEFRNGLLRVKRQAANLDPQDAENISNARLALENDAKSLLKCLTESNCDPRLVEAIKEIEEIVSSKKDIIRLGLVSFTCDHLFSRFADELPDIAVARFQGFSVGIGLYVCQFHEWQRFTENAAKADFEKSDVNRTYQIGKALLPKLRAASQLVDPEVPQSIELVLEALRNPKLSAKRALFGAVRTLENLLAKVFSEFAGLLSSVSEGARRGIKQGAGILVAGGLLLAAGNAASALSPTAERVAKAVWLKKAADIISKGLKEIE